MKKIQLDEINKETKLEFVVEYLQSIISDRFPRDELTPYELGKESGKVEVMNMLLSRVKAKEEE